jgi:type IV secretory pathway TrbL component
MTSSSHHSQHQTHERINHSSPNKGNSSIGLNSASANNGGINMMGSQAGSIQQGSVGGISGIGGISGMSSSGARPSMNQTQHGKSFPYSMHRKTNSNKLPHIATSNSKDNTSQSIQQ